MRLFNQFAMMRMPPRQRMVMGMRGIAAQAGLLPGFAQGQLGLYRPDGGGTIVSEPAPTTLAPAPTLVTAPTATITPMVTTTAVALPTNPAIQEPTAPVITASGPVLSPIDYASSPSGAQPYTPEDTAQSQSNPEPFVDEEDTQSRPKEEYTYAEGKESDEQVDQYTDYDGETDGDRYAQGGGRTGDNYAAYPQYVESARQKAIKQPATGAEAMLRKAQSTLGDKLGGNVGITVAGVAVAAGLYFAFRKKR